MAASKSGEIDRSPIHLLHRLSQCAMELFQKELGDSDLTPRQLAIMIAVADSEGSSQTALVNKTGIDRSTMADVVRRLTKRGWLQRRRTPADARAYAVKLTEAGWAELRRATPLARRVDNNILQALPRKDADGFMARLQSLVLALERKD
jgi:MarR family transcriptional regulator, temperature-dependent positive regulator of motility